MTVPGRDTAAPALERPVPSGPALRHYVATGLGALGIAWAPILVVLSDARPVAVAFWRYAYALPLLAALVALRRAPRSGFRERDWVPVAALAGVLFTVDLVLWHAAIGHVGAGPATILANTHVVWITLYGIARLGERPGKVFWLALPLLALGMWLLVGGTPHGIPDAGDRAGLALGVGTGAAYAGVLVCIRAAGRGRTLAPESVLLVQISTAFLVLLPLAAGAHHPVVRLPASAHPWLALLGVGCQVLSWWGITWGIRRLFGYHGALMLLAQPVGSVVLGWLVLGQRLGAERLLGAAVVVAAITLVVLRDAPRPR